MKKRKHYTAQKKTMILREHLENQVSVSELSERYKINPNMIHKWKKQLFEGAEEIFNTEQKRGNKSSDLKITQLEAKLRDKDTLISELVQENIQFKKNFNGEA